MTNSIRQVKAKRPKGIPTEAPAIIAVLLFVFGDAPSVSCDLFTIMPSTAAQDGDALAVWLIEETADAVLLASIESVVFSARMVPKTGA